MARHVRRRQRSHLLHRMPDTICQLLARTAIRRYRRELGRYISETADRRRSRVTQGGIMIALIALLIITGGTGFLIWIARNKDRKSTRLNSSHVAISYAVFCLKKKNEYPNHYTLNDATIDSA